MQNKIGAERQRLLPPRRQECVVDEKQRTRRVSGCGDRGNVDDAKQRIAGRLHPNELRLKRNGPRERLAIGLIHELDLECASAREPGEQTIGTAIAIMRSDQQFICPQQMRHERNRRHPRCSHDAADTAFQRGDRLSQGIPRRVPGAGVVVAALLTEAGERVRRSKVDRRHDSAVLRIGFEGRAYGLRSGCLRFAHDLSPAPVKTWSKIDRKASTSFRNASWPYSDEISNNCAGPASRSRRKRMSSTGTN